LVYQVPIQAGGSALHAIKPLNTEENKQLKSRTNNPQKKKKEKD
jgi:hypothetical protein